MMRILILVALCALFAVPAFAGSGLTPDALSAGGSSDWIDRGSGGEPITQLSVAFSYDIVLSEYGKYGLSFWQYIMAAPGSDGANQNDWITESSVVWWNSLFDAQLETFLGGSYVKWGTNVTGVAENLGGPCAGIRAPIEWADSDGDGVEETPVLWMEARGKFYKGRDGIRQWGINFGPVFSVGS